MATSLQNLSSVTVQSTKAVLSHKARHPLVSVHYIDYEVTVNLDVATTLPTLFSATQLYSPSSLFFVLTMKKSSMKGMLMKRISWSAANSLLSSFIQYTFGVGYPTAPHSSLTLWPSATVLSFGLDVNFGKAVRRLKRLKMVSLNAQMIILKWLKRLDVNCNEI